MRLYRKLRDYGKRIHGQYADVCEQIMDIHYDFNNKFKLIYVPNIKFNTSCDFPLFLTVEAKGKKF